MIEVKILIDDDQFHGLILTEIEEKISEATRSWPWFFQSTEVRHITAPIKPSVNEVKVSIDVLKFMIIGHPKTADDRKSAIDTMVSTYGCSIAKAIAVIDDAYRAPHEMSTMSWELLRDLDNALAPFGFTVETSGVK